jgi:hypothetical protein
MTTTLTRGVIAGAVLGVVARCWMRLISNDPEFSWNGTLGIVGGFTLWGFAQGVVIGVRHRRSRRWIVSLTRAFGVLGTLPLFVGAGGILAPTVILGGLAIHRTEWRSVYRLLLGLVASAPVVFVAVQIHDDHGWSWRWWLGVLGLVVIWGGLTLGSRPTFARHGERVTPPASR